MNVQGKQDFDPSNPNANQRKPSPKKADASRLAEHPDCAEDVQQFCPGKIGNMGILQCMQDVQGKDVISAQCQHLLWSYKQKLTKDLSFEGAGKELCQNALREIPECSELDAGKGLVVSCLIEHMNQIKEQACISFLSKMELIVFSDYRLIYKFAEACNVDIQKTGCGRLSQSGNGNDEMKLPHGEVISCLSGKADELDLGCKKEILRLAELQSDSYNKDRALYHACRVDAARLCADVISVRSGNGEVYKCLYRNKNNPDMSDMCRDKLTARQKLERIDYKVNRGLASACRADIMQYHCIEQSKNVPDYREAKLSVILLCLEAARTAGKHVAPECLSEMNDVRRSLMSDYQLTPEIVYGCVEEINQCADPISRKILANGQTLHCLMDRARKSLQQRVHVGDVNGGFNDQCLKAVSHLLKEVNIRENIDLDPVIVEACSSVIDLKCKHRLTSNGRLMDCLMDYVDKPHVIPRGSMCREKLMEVQYFISRDFTLSARFYRTCKSALDEKGPCHFDTTKDVSASRQSDILLCLYRKGRKNEINQDCAIETSMVMMERAKSVDLPADVEESCREDLATYCSEKTQKNEEMDCLEDNYESLHNEQCKEAVKRYIEEEEDEPELNEIIRDECEPIISKHCKDAGGDDADDDDVLSESLMQCLIRNKHDEEMNKKCRSQVTHHQIVTMKDWHLSKDFKEACAKDVQEHCKVAEIKTKSAVITCLSELIRNATLFERKHDVDRKCRKQLKFELLQMSSNIELDNELSVACKKDKDRLCPNIDPGQSSVINCLREHQTELQHDCRAIVFKRELREAQNPETDFLLMTKCKRMIKKYCRDDLRTPVAIFTCLVKNKEEEDFDQHCKKIVVSRERTRMQDVRLNPELMRECQTDIREHCSIVSLANPTDVEGKVLYCLRKIFASQAYNYKQNKPDSVKRLTEGCYGHVKQLVKESVLDYMQDRHLAVACKELIEDHCLQETIVDNNELGDRGLVIDCLKKVVVKDGLKNAECFKEVARVSMESKADVQVDPLLYRACALDIKHSCNDVPPGEGRRMSCLLDLNANHKGELRPECSKALSDRVQLWELAAQKAGLETVQEVIGEISRSPARNYLFAVLFACIGILFLTGILCGRVTKRVARQVKNR